MKDIYIYQYGFADVEKDLDIHFDTIGEGTASIVGITGKQSENIHLRTVDDFSKENNIEHIDFMKIDVEGYEYFVLK